MKRRMAWFAETPEDFASELRLERHDETARPPISPYYCTYLPTLRALRSLLARGGRFFLADLGRLAASMDSVFNDARSGDTLSKHLEYLEQFGYVTRPTPRAAWYRARITTAGDQLLQHKFRNRTETT